MRLYGSRRKLAESIIQESVRQAVSQSGSGGGITALTGDVTASGSGSVAATIAADAVTYAKMQNVSAASRLLGRGSAAGSGDVQELTVGTGLSLSGTVLSATATGNVVGPVSATDNAIARFDVTGTVIQNSSITVSDVATSNVTLASTGSNSLTISSPQDLTLTKRNSGLMRLVSGTGGVRFEYNSTNYLAVSQDGTGFITYSIEGGTGNQGHLFSESLYVIAGSASDALVVTTTGTNQASFQYDGSNRLDISVSIAGVVTYDAVGASQSHVFSDSVQATEFRVSGTKVVGAQGATISDPTGGTVQDSEARTAINTIIDRLQAHGLIA